MKLNLDLPYSRGKLREGEVLEKNTVTSTNIINHAISTCYPEGFDGSGSERRMFGRLQKKLDKVGVEDLTDIDLELSEVDFLAKTLETAKMPVFWSKFVMVLEDALAELKKAEPAEAPAPTTK